MSRFTDRFCLRELERSIWYNVFKTLRMSFMLVSLWLYKRSRRASENRRDTLQGEQEKQKTSWLDQLSLQFEQSTCQEHPAWLQGPCGPPLTHSSCPLSQHLRCYAPTHPPCPKHSSSCICTTKPYQPSRPSPHAASVGRTPSHAREHAHTHTYTQAHRTNLSMKHSRQSA